MSPFGALLRKDLRVELRTLRSLPAMALFAVSAFVIFRFGLDRTSLDGELAAGVLVPTLLFAALLAINRLFVAEREEGGFDLIRLAPIDPTVLFAAKASALVIYLVVLELIAVPIFALFFLDSASGLVPFALVLLLAGIGLYGVASYTVTLRRTEIGVRMALGADAGRVQRMVVSRMARLVAIGVIVGAAASFWASR